MRIPLMIISVEHVKPVTHRLKGVGGVLAGIFPRLRVDLVEIESGIEADEYIALSLLSAFLYALGGFSLFSIVLYALGAALESILIPALFSGLIIFILFFFVLLFYPSILAGKKAEQIEKDLIFALKNMLLEISSGATVYRAMVEVSRAGYGQVSKELEKVVKMVNTGTPVDTALEELALRTTSGHFRKSIWQIVNALKVGSNIENSLRELIKGLVQEQRAKITNYTQELNMVVLIYMMFAVVVPTIMITLLIVICPFMGLGLGHEAFYVVLIISFFVQIALLEFIKSRRPIVYL